MNGKEAIRTALTETRNLLGWYVSDLSDADLLVRPCAGANHAAWQLGHLIDAEGDLLRSMLPGAAYPALPAGFAERHGADKAASDSTEGYLTRAEYLDLFARARSATLDALDKLTDADLDRPNQGRMAKLAPTLGALLLLASNHVLMHAGQFSVIRRKLGKPVLF
ncbi:MAG: DinB family protein [Gemmataceae bacterium]|nr:DinB family protein [Gemmataceae bacterium]